MKFGAIYSGAVSLTEQEREEKGLKPRDEVNPNPTTPAEDAASAQETLNWLQSPVTASFLKNLGSEFEESINEAIKLSVGFSSHQNPYRIIQLLNKAYELRKLLQKYGRTRNSNQS